MTDELPTIDIKEPELYVEATDYEDPYDLKELAEITALDSNRNDISETIIINEDSIDYQTPGDYTISVSASDDDLNTAISQILIHVVEPEEEDQKLQKKSSKDQLKWRKSRGQQFKEPKAKASRRHNVSSENGESPSSDKKNTLAARHRKKGTKRINKNANKQSYSKISSHYLAKTIALIVCIAIILGLAWLFLTN